MRSLGVDMDDKDNVSATAGVGVGGALSWEPGQEQVTEELVLLWLGFVLRIGRCFAKFLFFSCDFDFVTSVFTRALISFSLDKK